VPRKRRAPRPAGLVSLCARELSSAVVMQLAMLRLLDIFSYEIEGLPECRSSFQTPKYLFSNGLIAPHVHSSDTDTKRGIEVYVSFDFSMHEVILTVLASDHLKL